jgi:hypothetical protein
MEPILDGRAVMLGAVTLGAWRTPSWSPKR